MTRGIFHGIPRKSVAQLVDIWDILHATQNESTGFTQFNVCICIADAPQRWVTKVDCSTFHLAAVAGM